ncbi:tyrosine-type recombinase/integrase [Flavobacterium sp.]|uniref:tyrosine-type recombinase/integrase n=1 Tax=Flavobacterium sp. TaxID=239 RepID=UPI00391A5A5D
MKTRFYLRKSTKSYSINFEYRDAYLNIRLRTSTGYSILNSKSWDDKKEQLKLPSSVPNAAEINTILSEAISSFNKFMLVARESEVSELSIQKFMDQLFKKKKHVSTEIDNVQKRTLIDYYEWFLKFYSENNSPYTNKKLTKGTIKTYRSGLTRLQEYINSKGLNKFSFHDCNRDFYNNYIRFLTEKNYSKNYIGTIIQKLKTILGYAYDEGIHSNNEFKKQYFSKLTEEIDHVYLSIEELGKINSLTLTDDELDNIRDIFLIGSFTGLRISDLLGLLKKSNQIYVQDGYKYFSIRQQKTSNSVVIPLNSIVLEILKKRNGKLPVYMHQNLINQHIKCICKRAKITNIHVLRRTEGGNEIEYELPKYKLVSSHTARRSFCTNAYKSGMPIQDIMAISGHKSEKVFMNYVKVEKTENAKRIAKHAFFN